MLNLEGDEIKCLGWCEFRKTEITKAVRMPQDFKVKSYYGQPTQGEAGDYLLMDHEGNLRSCPFHEFIASYVEMDSRGR